METRQDHWKQLRLSNNETQSQKPNSLPWNGLNNEDSLSTNWFFYIHSSFCGQENTTHLSQP